MTISDSKLVFGSAFKSCDAVFHQKVTADLPFVQGLGVNKARWFKEPRLCNSLQRLLWLPTWWQTQYHYYTIYTKHIQTRMTWKKGWNKGNILNELQFASSSISEHRGDHWDSSSWNMLRMTHILQASRWLTNPLLRHHTDKPQGPRKARRCSWRKGFWVSADGMCVAIWYQWLVSSCIRHQYNYEQLIQPIARQFGTRFGILIGKNGVVQDWYTILQRVHGSVAIQFAWGSMSFIDCMWHCLENKRQHRYSTQQENLATGRDESSLSRAS